jgi:ketosteroid isomerase-like protein
MGCEDRSGSKADLTGPKSDFRFTPESGLKSDIAPCPKSANKRLMHRSNLTAYSITSSAQAVTVDARMFSVAKARLGQACSTKVAETAKLPLTRTMEEAMNIGRRELILPVLAIGLLGVVPAFAAADEDAVAKSVEAFRAAQAAANAEALAALCATELSYSHSDGHVEDKATFIANATNGKTKWLSLEYKDPKIRVVGPAAIVRFNWVGESEAIADGKKSSTNLHILMNWQKQGEDWKLLSRAATKL